MTTNNDLAVQLFEHMQSLINFADTKAQLTLAADALLAATITTMSQQVMVNLLNGNALPLARIAGLLGVLMFVALLLSIYFALVVARPVLHVSGARNNSLLYFGHIVQYSEKEFIEAFMSLTDEEAQATAVTDSCPLEDRLAQVHRYSPQPRFSGGGVGAVGRYPGSSGVCRISSS
jgi:hypothetical protein